jgi:hypothetical protein
MWYIRDREVKEQGIVNLLCTHYFMMAVELKYLIGSGYLKIFDGVCQAIKTLQMVGFQPIKILHCITYYKSTNENALSHQTMCIDIRQGTVVALPPFGCAKIDL